MKKVNLLAVGGEPKPPNGVAAHGGPPTIVVSDAPEQLGDAAAAMSGKGGSGSDGGRSPDRRKAEKKERERLEKLERKEQKKLEKEQKKSPKGGDGGKEAKDVIIPGGAAGGKDASPSASTSASTPSKDTGSAKLADRFLGSKVAMEKFFKKKVKEREERKEKEKEERERERVLLEELSASGDEGGGGSDGGKKKPKKKKKSKSKIGSRISIGKGYYSEGSNDDGLVDGRKKKRKTFYSSSGGSASSSSTSTSPSSSYTPPSPSTTPPDKDKDPMERETEREEEKEEETTDSDESSSSDDDDDSESEEEPTRGKGSSLLHPNSGNNPLQRQHRRKKDWTVSQEFRVLALETEEKQKPDFSFALQHKNRDKNRYGNALPNPETRVVLKGGDTDYINANYIQGEQTQYIAAQAPLPNTFSDFWLMVWEQNTRVIMMLTRLTENDRTKAEIYWPRKGPLGRARGGTSEDGGWKQYGKMRVSLVKSTVQEGDEDVTIRYFRLRNDEEPDVERQVIQIHFTGWPDFGVPQNTKAFTQLLELMESFNQEPTITDSTEPNGPIVLHCSAGLGRTGTLIAAHIAAEKLKLQRVKSKEDIDMKAIVALLREQRSGMVQTKCQYKFLHDLLKDL